MKRTWTIIGVGDVPGSFKWYQALFGQPATLPAHDYFGQILDSDGTVLLCLHEWGAHEHPSLMSPDHGTPGNGLLLFFRVDDFDLALQRARSLVTRLRRGATRESEHSNQGVLAPRSGRILRYDQCALRIRRNFRLLDQDQGSRGAPAEGRTSIQYVQICCSASWYATALGGKKQEGHVVPLFPAHVLRFLIVPKRYKLAVPQVRVLVHSTNSNCPTSTGFSHRHSAIFGAVSPAPQRPAFFSGRFANGHSLISSGLSFLNSSARDAGVKPLRVRAAYIRLAPS